MPEEGTEFRHSVAWNSRVVEGPRLKKSRNPLCGFAAEGFL